MKREDLEFAIKGFLSLEIGPLLVKQIKVEITDIKNERIILISGGNILKKIIVSLDKIDELISTKFLEALAMKFKLDLLEEALKLKGREE